jgi:nitrite reductase/ring-hydroxylating ferredoxin subunit/uncharacterized membrane protein
MKEPLIESIALHPWLQPAEAALDALAKATVEHATTPLKNLLHGTSLGHPLHSAITDVPIGAWTTATVLDLIDAVEGSDRLAAGAQAAVGLGLLGATLAAASGLADWSQVKRKPVRQVGVMHAVCNGGATFCYLASWLLRRRGERAAATSTGLIGWALVMAGGFLGGHLAFQHKVGADHAQREGPENFTPLLPEADLLENTPHRADLDGTAILLVRQGGRIFAIGEKCAHRGGPLSEGKIEGDSIRCPWHGSRFALEGGRVLEGPSAYSQACFETRVLNGQIEVRLGKKM